MLLVFAFTLMQERPAVTANGPTVETTGYELLKKSEALNQADQPAALRTAQDALAKFEASGDLAGAAKAYAQIGRSYFAMNELTSAEFNYKQSITRFQQTGDKPGEARSLIMLGYVAARGEEFELAVSYFLQAENSLAGNEDQLLAGMIASGLAYTFEESGSFESALAHSRRALEIFERAQNVRAVSRMLMAIGRLHFLEGDFSAARNYLNQALEKFELALDIAECNEYLAKVDFALGDRNSAIKRLLPLPSQYRDSGNLRDAARVEVLLGEIYQAERSYAAARTNYLDALSIFQRLTDHVGEASASFGLGKLELASQNYQLAESYLSASLKHSEDIQKLSSAREFSVAQSAKAHDRYAVYIECLMAQNKLRPSPDLETRAFEASERGRARSLVEFLAETQTKLPAYADQPLVLDEKRLRTAIRAKEDYKISMLETDYKMDELQRVEIDLEKLRNEYDEKVQALQLRNPAYSALTIAGETSLKEVQEEVVHDSNDLLLEYHIGASVSYAWAITKLSISSYELPREAVIVEKLRKVYELVSQPPTRENQQLLNEASVELSQLVLRPLADHPSISRLIVVSDGALNYIPFQLLQFKGEPLVAKYEVANIPSASVMVQLRKENRNRQPARQLLAAFGDSVFSTKNAGVATANGSTRAIQLKEDSLDLDNIGELFYSGIELANLRRLAGSGTLIATKYEASREKLEHTDFSQFAILHLATHGYLNTTHPESSGFVLSLRDREGRPIDGFVSLKDLYSLRVPVDLVVLSACRTGLGKEIKGEGLIGLTRGFMYAGASSVIASLWTVDDEATAELMKRFYENVITRDMSPASALRAAQNSIRQEPRWNSPYYWAAFTIQGDYQQKIRVKPRPEQLVTKNAVMGMGAVLLMSIAAGFYLWKRKHQDFTSSKI